MHRRLALAAAGAAVALVGVTLAAPGDDPAGAAGSAEAAPAGQLAAAPAALRQSSMVEFEARKDYRSVDTGITVNQTTKTGFVWGLGYYGISGGDAGVSDSEYHNYPPTPVEGLPQGGVKDMAGQIYNFNALDEAGCVWGWGSYASRDGTGQVKGRQGTGGSWPPKKVKINGKWNDGSKPDLCNVSILTASEQAGAAVTKDGYIYSWGNATYGGTDLDGGAKLVTGLPDPTIEGNKPIQLEGGYMTIWVLLESGDVYYFGFSSINERPAGDDDYDHAGQKILTAKGIKKSADPGGSYMNHTVLAARSDALAPWFKRNNPDEYIIQVHTGIYFGAALLSTGRVVTWGKDHYQAIGRGCYKTTSKGTTYSQDNCTDAQTRKPAYLEVGDGTPKLVRLSCSFTAIFALAEDGTLWGWGAGGAYVSYEYASYPRPGVVAYNVKEFQTGQGYVIWRHNNDTVWAQGYNPRGSTGHKASMNGTSYATKHEVWFAGLYFRSCSSSEMAKPSNTCYALNQAWDGITGPARKYQYRFTLDECTSKAAVDFVWPAKKDAKGKYSWPWDGRKGLCA
jgi:hypothetical protein